MDQQSKNIIRVEKNQDYTIINNKSLYDERLSWKAKAIHVFMLSKPDNWTFYNEEMVQWAKDGLDSFSSGLKELKKFGYVKKEKRRGSNGKFEWVTVVYEVPHEPVTPYPEKPCMEKPPMEKPYMENPSVEEPSMEKPFVENPELLNTNALSTESLSTYSLNTDIPNTNTKKVVVEEPATPANQNPFSFYMQNGFGLTINDITRQKIIAWCEDLSDELVVYAMQISMERNKTSWSYAEGILRKWAAKHVKSIDDVHALLAQYEAQKQQQSARPSYKKGRREIVPEWFEKEKERLISEPERPNATEEEIKARKEALQNRMQQDENIDFEAERQKILAKLAE